MTLMLTIIGRSLCSLTSIGSLKKECLKEWSRLLSKTTCLLHLNMAFVRHILDIVNAIQSNMDNRLLSCGIFIDLKKAFDTADHKILLRTLDHYSFRGIINIQFSSYLQGRTQTTQIGPHISERLNSTYGVPQGSVLGPLLFLLYINDIQESSDKLRVYLFADDTNILFADKNLKSLELSVNLELNKVYDWLTANKLTLNIKKSNFVIFCTAQRKLTYLSLKS